MFKILNKILIFISAVIIYGGLVYRFYALNSMGVSISLILAIISFIIIRRIDRKYNTKHGTWNIEHGIQIPHIKYLLSVIACFYILLSHRTAGAIISPWQVVPSYFFIFYSLATAFLIAIILNAKRYALLLLSLHYFLSLSVALIIYKIGYGFDPFIHQATVDLIDKIGAVDPKPFYYLGQYAIVIIVHKITAAPLVWLDKFLVPLLTAVYLPLFIFNATAKLFENKKTTLLTAAASLALPLPFFIVTTPQNLAYLFLLLTILFGLTAKNTFELAVIFLFTAAALIIHPIAGIPALAFALMLAVHHSSAILKPLFAPLLRGGREVFYALIFIFSSVALPIIFYLWEKGNAVVASVAEAPVSSPKFIVPGDENFILNFIYLYGFNIKTIIIILAATGIIIAYRERQKYKLFFLYFLMSAALFASYLLTTLLPFNFLINYERENYSERLLLISAFFLLPFILLAVSALIDKTLKQAKSVKIIFLIFFTFLISASLYLSYPRFDNYFNSRGYSTSANDIAAVRWIEENRQKDYIVLANQQVSAAALREYGFAKYYRRQNTTINGQNNLEIRNSKLEIFYYPIPTGGPLYRYYLDMVYKKPSRATMLAAMDLAGVSEGYFVLNKYWWAFPKILEEAKLEADNWKKIGNGEIYVFEYKK
ncbi:hypothetical protein HY798_00375 [Candidatus Falkowbacteria bacterium]|nr:hypothetical protein [Candidatus Falkowbacteria bacterium]